MSISVREILDLIGKELKDNEDSSKRFRDFISKEKWTLDQYKEWLDECVNNSSGPQSPYNQAFQDIVVCLGSKIGFEVHFGRYSGRAGKPGYDGLWRRPSGETILVETKISTWPIGSIQQLGNYIDKYKKENDVEKVYGLYVIGKGEVQALIEQILGSRYKDSMRLITYGDLIELLRMKDQLVPVIGEEQAKLKIQNLLFPVESINIGNILKLIIELSTAKTTEVTEEAADEKLKEKEEQPWTKEELLSYLNDCTPYQRIFLAALVQSNEEQTTRKQLILLMNKLARSKPEESIQKEITGYDIAGARAGLKMRRKPLKKEDVIFSDWDSSVGDYIYKIKPQYKNIIFEWAKKENLLLRDYY